MNKLFNTILLMMMLIVNLSCQKEISTAPEDVYLVKNYLFIDSNPQGAVIYLDNKITGQRTPDTLTWVQAGQHLITLKLTNFKDSSVIVDVKEDVINSILFDYTTNPTMRGRLFIDSEPRGADIYLNDELTSFVTPKAIDGLFPGDYTVKYKYPGHLDLEIKTTVVSGRSITVFNRLTDTLTWVNYNKTTADLPTNYFSSVDIEDGYIKWFGSWDSGLLRFDEIDWTVFNTSNSAIPSDNVTSVKVAANGIWVGTDNGLAYFSNGVWQVFNVINSPLKTDLIQSIHIDHTGKVWVASYSKGLYVIDNGNWTVYDTSNTDMTSDFIRSVYVEPNGKAWVGTYGGLFSFDGITWESEYDSLFPPSNSVEAVLLDDMSNIYVGFGFFGLTPGGFAVRKNGEWQSYYYLGQTIIFMTKGIDNDIWIASWDKGLIKYRDSGWQLFNTDNSKLLSNKINSIAIDGAGHKWITTWDRGVAKYKGN